MITDWETDYKNVMIMGETAFMVENDTKGVGVSGNRNVCFLERGTVVSLQYMLTASGRIVRRVAKISPPERIRSPRGISVQ